MHTFALIGQLTGVFVCVARWTYCRRSASGVRFQIQVDSGNPYAISVVDDLEELAVDVVERTESVGSRVLEALTRIR